ncbi:MAG: hypothetical protein JOZ36_12910 [Acidobacteria bacterium]|nr:hypothetical protein [Acidobacteriota bacterium]
MNRSDGKREMLRHALATLAYRGGKALRGAPPGFAEYRVADGTRCPIEILAHICDLVDWALSIAAGDEKWNETRAAVWDGEVERFFTAMKALDDFLAADRHLEADPERLFQGPIADALTHVGQLTMLRRLAGAPVKGENYSLAEVQAGRVGPVQSAPKREFY